MEIVSGLGGFILAILVVSTKNAFFKGNSQAILKTVVDDIIELKNSMANVEKQSLLNEQAIITIQKDHMKIDETVTILNNNISKNNQALASLEATMKGLEHLLQNIFDGNLKISTK